MVNVNSWASVIWWYRPSWETETIFNYPIPNTNTWHTQLENPVIKSCYPGQRKANAVSIKCSGLTDTKLLSFYSHCHSSLWKEKFCNPIHIAAGGIEAVYELFHRFSYCLLTENLQARTVTAVILGAKLLLYTEEEEEHYYDHMTWGYRLFRYSNHFTPLPVDTC